MTRRRRASGNAPVSAREPRVFADRLDAGRQLSAALSGLGDEDPVVLGLPRGGVPVAAVVARSLGAPLDVVVVRKLRVTGAPELAMGALGEGGVRVLNLPVLRAYGVSEADLAQAESEERAELEGRVRRLRGGRPPIALTGRTAIVVDDGVATGATARAACAVVRALGARRVVLAVPVASPRALAALEEVADRVVCVTSPAWLSAVGEAYRDFAPVTEEEVVSLLAGSGTEAPLDPVSPSRLEDVEVRTGGASLTGRLALPAGGESVVVFAHGTGSSRHSPRNRHVAHRLEQAGLGTLLLDLLTPDEARDPGPVPDVDLSGRRLLDATHWLRREAGLDDAAVGYFGASTGAAAALWAAADPSSDVRAVVSRGGRPDLVLPLLHRVEAPTLLIVGGEDRTVQSLNRHAMTMMHGVAELAVVPGAGHLFEEPGTLETVADLAADWFTRHLVQAAGEPLRLHGPAAPRPRG